MYSTVRDIAQKITDACTEYRKRSQKITVINNSIVNIELGKKKLDINDISVKTEFCS
jgi:hypothetical protein